MPIYNETIRDTQAAAKLAARLEVAERDLRDVRALLDATRHELDRAQRTVVVLVGSLTELIEAAETQREIAQDAREAIRLATGAR